MCVYLCKSCDFFDFCIGLSTSQYLGRESNTIRVDNFQCDKSITVIAYLDTCDCKQITMEMLELVYQKNSELPHSNDNRITDYELSVAASLCASDLKKIVSSGECKLLRKSHKASMRRIRNSEY